MTHIRAIPTRYKGYLTRSRLEARWIVAFEAIDIDFQYELDGFVLPSGWYLPDFFLPQVQMWGEVKPFDFTPAEKQRCKELSDLTGFPTLLLIGPPDFKTYYAVHSADDEAMIGDLPEGGIRYECDYLLDIHYHGRRYYERERRFYSSTAGEFSLPHDFTEEYRHAVHLARSARFDGQEAA